MKHLLLLLLLNSEFLDSVGEWVNSFFFFTVLFCDKVKITNHSHTCSILCFSLIKTIFTENTKMPVCNPVAVDLYCVDKVYNFRVNCRLVKRKNVLEHGCQTLLQGYFFNMLDTGMVHSIQLCLASHESCSTNIFDMFHRQFFFVLVPYKENFWGEAIVVFVSCFK